jgi:hypothetical protein
MINNSINIPPSTDTAKGKMEVTIDVAPALEVVKSKI